jgi:small GTP-binding protein
MEAKTNQQETNQKVAVAMQYPQHFKVVLVGARDSGKQTLMDTFCNGPRGKEEYRPTVFKNQQTTVQTIEKGDTIVCELETVDTSGQEGYSSLCSMSYAGADAFICCVNSVQSIEEAQQRWLPSIASYKKPILIVVVDTVETGCAGYCPRKLACHCNRQVHSFQPCMFHGCCREQQNTLISMMVRRKTQNPEKSAFSSLLTLPSHLRTCIMSFMPRCQKASTWYASGHDLPLPHTIPLRKSNVVLSQANDLAKHLNTYKQQSYCFFAHAEYGELSANSNNVDYIFEDVVRSCLQLESKRHLSLKYVVVEEEEEEKTTTTTNEEAKTIDTIYL